MRVSLLATAFLAAGAATAFAQDPWMNVKSWSGTVTVEATNTRHTTAPEASSKTVYRATGPFTISDDMLPAGSHVQWPMPSVETLSKNPDTAFDRWQAHLTGTFEFNGFHGESGKRISITCSADETKASKVFLAKDPVSTGYVLRVSPQEAKFQCPPGLSPPVGYLNQTEFELKGDQRTLGRLTGSKTFDVPNGTVKISYEMAPSR